MKRFLSFLCAVLVVVSAAAVPARGLSKVQKAKLSAQRHEQVNFKNREALKAAKFEAGKTAVTRAEKAPKAAQDVVIVSARLSVYDGEVNYSLLSEDEADFEFAFPLGEGAQDVELGKTYTEEDMNPDNSYLFDTDFEFYDYISASFTKTIDGEGATHIEARVVTEVAEYALHFKKDAFVPTGDTIRIEFENSIREPEYLQSYGEWVISASNDEYAVTLDFAGDPESIAGEYEGEDFDLGYTYVAFVDGDDLEYLETIDAKAVITESEGRIDVLATIVAEDGNVYEAKFFFQAPKAEAQETITSEEMRIAKQAYLFWEIYVFSAKAENGAEVLLYLTEDNYYGTWKAGSDISGIVITTDSDTTEVYSGEVVIASIEGGVSLTGKVLCWNNVEYTLDLKYFKPVPSKEITLSITNSKLNILNGAWQVMAESQDGAQFISIAAYGDFKQGKWTSDDLADSYTYVELIQGADTLDYLMVDADVDITLSNDEAGFAGFLVGQNWDDAKDIIQFNFDFSAIYEEPEDDSHMYDEPCSLNQYFPTFTVDDRYLEEYGSIYVEAENEQGFGIILDITLPLGANELVPGVYTIDDSYDPQTVYAGQYSETYGFIPSFMYTLIEEEGKLYYNQIWWIVDGTVTVSEEGHLLVEAHNSLGYKLTAFIANYPEGVENTADEVKASKKIRNGQLVIVKDGVEFNAQGTVLK